MKCFRVECVLALLLPILAGCGQGAAPSGATAKSESAPAIIKTKSGVEMVEIPAGSFEMGSRGRAGETPHTVKLDAFYMDRTEVTQELFKKIGVRDASHFKDDPKNPVEMIPWDRALEFCNARSKAEGLTPCYNDDLSCNFAADGYRLPTEAEWEYACRAGGTKDYSFGGDPRTLGDYAWFKDNAGKKSHAVAQKKPNAWGLYDMHGNVAEWCNDPFDADYYAKSPPENPRGPAEGDKCVLRGGAWESSAEALRSGARAGEKPGFQDACFKLDAIGFRCVRRK
jgi:sulfatase modifying factor 1